MHYMSKVLHQDVYVSKCVYEEKLSQSDFSVIYVDVFPTIMNYCIAAAFIQQTDRVCLYVLFYITHITISRYKV